MKLLIIKINKSISAVLTTFILLGPANVLAAVTDAFVSTAQNTPITIVLNNNITFAADVNFDSITITPPSNGQADPVPGVQQIVYTPNATFNGDIDVFTYTVLDAGGQSLGSATITVSVGIAVVNTEQNVAQAEISDLLNDTCITPADQGFNDICIDYFNATEGERAALANQLAPREIDGQTQISTTVASQQIDTIRKRLAALRQGMQGINSIQLSYQHKDQRPISIADLFQDDTTGGAASALGTPARRVSVFTSGNFGGGGYSPEANGNEDGYSYNSRGLTVGADYRLDGQTVFGVAAGVINSQMSIANNGGDLEVKGFSGVAYGSYYISSKVYIELIGALYLNSFSATRNIEYVGVDIDPNTGQVIVDVNGDPVKINKKATALSETDNGVLSASVGSGFELMSNRGMTVNISGNLDYIESGIDGYQETGAAGANLTIAKRRESTLTSVVDLQVTYAISQRSGVLIPQFGLTWKHELLDDSNTIEGAFASDPVNTKFTFDTQAPETDYFNANVGVQFLIPGGTTGFAHYQHSIQRKDKNNYSLSAGMRGEF